MPTALLTGASGKIGRHVVGALGRRGFEVVATDLVRNGVPSDVRFEACDLTDASAVSRLVGAVKPDVVVHCAAVVAPVAYVEPEVAEAVNLGAVQHLIDTVKTHAPDAFFVFASSYAVFGPCGPGDPFRSASDPCYPDDNYGLQKLTAESWLQQSGLRQCALRIGAVMDLHNLMPEHPAYRPFVFMVSLAQPEHGVDVRDVARALASAAVAQPDGHVLLVGGDDSWKLPAGQLREEVFGAIGLSVPRESAFRSPTDPNDRSGWFYESWMDTAQTEALLRFQRVTHDEFMAELRRNHRGRRFAFLPLRPLVSHAITLVSPYTGKNAIDAGPTIWDDICQVYEVPPNVARARSSKPPPPSPFERAPGVPLG